MTFDYLWRTVGEAKEADRQVAKNYQQSRSWDQVINFPPLEGVRAIKEAKDKSSIRKVS